MFILPFMLAWDETRVVLKISFPTMPHSLCPHTGYSIFDKTSRIIEGYIEKKETKDGYFDKVSRL